MNTSKYTSSERYNLKRDLRHPDIEALLDKGRAERQKLQDKLTERNLEIERLKAGIGAAVKAGQWHDSWEHLGFKKPEE